MNILFVAPDSPFPVTSGSNLIVAQLARALSQANTLYFVGYALDNTNAAELREYFADVKLVRRKHLPRWRRWMVMLFDPLPWWVRLEDSDDFRAAVRTVLAEHRIDVVHLDMGQMALYMREMGSVPVVLAPHDSATLLLQQRMTDAPRWRERVVARLQFGRMKHFEATEFAAAQRVVMVTEREKEYMQTLAPTLALRVVPNGVDTDYFAALNATALPNQLGFHGVMNYRENETAVLEFARRILPQIRASIPDVTFTIIGKNPTPEIRTLGELAGVQVTGTVDDVRPYLAAQTVLVVPMLTTGGIKNKLLEAMAMGKPIVTTPEGADGIDARSGDDFVVARFGEEFATACVRLLNNAAERARLGANARTWALQHSWEQAAVEYLAVYQEAIHAAAVR